MTTLTLRTLTLAAGAGLLLAAHPGLAAPTATAGYTISTFGLAPAGASNPDSIAVSGSDVFVGFANGSSKTGDPMLGDSTIAEYGYDGSLLNTFSVVGHNDGLKIDPSGNLWAFQNEDGNPTLTIFNLSNSTNSGQINLTSSNSGGGYDDAVFQNGNVYISASNAQATAANNPDPVIVKATPSGGNFTFTSILNGNAVIPNSAAPGSAPVEQNLTDADSLTTTPNGSLLLTDQTANELITVSNPGTASQTASFVPTTDNAGNSIDVDDTVFPGGKSGRLLFSDTSGNNVYAISGNLSGMAYSAAPDANFVGSTDLATGVVTPIVTGVNAKGMGFLPDAAPAVPETSDLALLSGGLALLGLSVRRKSVRNRVS